MRNQTWKAYFYPRTKWGDKRALKVWFLIEIIVEIKIEIKKWFKLGFLDKIIKQIAFFDFYHFCEICDPRVAHHVHLINSQSLVLQKSKKMIIHYKKLELHAVLFWSRFLDMKWTCFTGNRVFLTQSRLKNENKSSAWGV